MSKRIRLKKDVVIQEFDKPDVYLPKGMVLRIIPDMTSSSRSSFDTTSGAIWKEEAEVVTPMNWRYMG